MGKSVRQRELNVLSSDAALELLQSLVDDDRMVKERDAATALCEWLGFLPLGVELVGRYLARKPEISLAEMQQGLRNKRLAQPALKKSKQDDDMTAQLGVAAAFELSWQELNENARELGCLLSLFALAPISWEWVKRCCPNLDDEDMEESRDDALTALHLLQVSERNTERCNFKLHQLIREFFQAKLAEDKSLEQKLKSAFVQSMLSISKPVPQEITLDIVRDLAPAIPHLKEVTGNLINYIPDDGLLTSFWGILIFYEGQGLYSQAETYCKYCLDITRSRLGEDHSDFAASVNNIAYLYESQGKYKEAEQFHVQALKLRQVGGHYSDIANSLNNLAELYRMQGRYKEAEPLYLKGIKLIKELLGEHHADFATILNNLALLYKAQGKYTEAELFHRQSLELRIEIFGMYHPHIASSLNNLASVYESQRRYEEAEILLLTSLQLIQEILGDLHPAMANSLNNLALLYKTQRRYKEAKLLYLKAFHIDRELLGERHPNLATDLNNLAGLYQSQGKYDEAETFYLKSLQLRQELLGNKHPKVAISLNNLASLRYKQKRYDDANSLLLQSLEICESVLGRNHPDTQSVNTSLEYLRLNHRKQTTSITVQ